MISDKEIIEKLKIKKTEKVLDVGGAMMQHDQIRIDTLVDIIWPEDAPYTSSNLKAKKFVQLDITRQKLPFKNKSFDVCLCTHTLEDIYNPFLILGEMQRVAKRGLIVTPSMGKDMVYSHLDITDWLTGARRTPGLSHHKWFFLNSGKKMLVIPKNYGVLFSETFQIVDWKGEDEFVCIWKDKIDFEIFPEFDIHKLIDFYEEFIRENRGKIRFGRVFKFLDNPIQVTKAYLKLLLRRGKGFSRRRL